MNALKVVLVGPLTAAVVVSEEAEDLRGRRWRS